MNERKELAKDWLHIVKLTEVLQYKPDEDGELIEWVDEENVNDLLKAVVTLNDAAMRETVRRPADPIARLLLAHCAYIWCARVQVALGNVNFENLREGQVYLLAAMGKVSYTALQELASLSDEEMEQASEWLINEGVFETTDVELLPDRSVEEID